MNWLELTSLGLSTILAAFLVWALFGGAES